MTYNSGDGWRNLIDTVIDQVKLVNRRIVVDQVRSLNGELVFHYHPRSERADAIVSLAKEIASSTCEQCGESGRLQSVNGEYMTLCAAHVKEVKTH